jgi:monovalent cation:H+ antiporter-2, CPA2 family
VPLVEESRRHGRPVYFGDASRAELLNAAGVERARAALITLDQPEAAERVVAALRRNHPDLRIIARSRDAAHARRLEAAGADAVILEALEPGLQMGAAVLRVAGTPASAIDRTLDALRRGVAA